MITTGLLAAVPFLIMVSLAAARVPSFNFILLFQTLIIPLFLSVVLIFVTLVGATTLIREEIEDQTMPYLLTRPISKPAIVLYKYLGYLISVLVLLVPPLVLAYAVTIGYSGDSFSADSDVLAGFLVTTVLGSAAYGALFLFLSVLVRKPLAIGLLIGFVWESIVGSLPGDVPKISVIHYLRSILKGMIAVGPLNSYTTDISAGLAAGILIAFTAAMIVLSLAVFQQMEFRQKA
ncbi:MAG TPA: ABC transporter permease subunit [Thermoplasmata archaeon]|nr:ABC transporter permease subunit [Thermoplasmata archaeon]